MKNMEWAVGLILFVLWVVGHVLTIVNKQKDKKELPRVVRIPRPADNDPVVPRKPAATEYPKVLPLKPADVRAAPSTMASSQAVERLRAKRAQALAPVPVPRRVAPVAPVERISPATFVAPPASITPVQEPMRPDFVPLAGMVAAGVADTSNKLEATFIGDLVGSPDSLMKAFILQTIFAPPPSRCRSKG
jgi:hypothetical protein